jgi:hypothetical protein
MVGRFLPWLLFLPNNLYVREYLVINLEGLEALTTEKLILNFYSFENDNLIDKLRDEVTIGTEIM